MYGRAKATWGLDTEAWQAYSKGQLWIEKQKHVPEGWITERDGENGENGDANVENVPVVRRTSALVRRYNTTTP